MKKRHEELSKNEFDRWLRTLKIFSSIEWVEPSEPHPDWQLLLDGKLWFVEATTIVPTVEQGKNQIMEPTVTASISDFIDEVEDLARSEDCLSGAYTVAVGPMPSRHSFRKQIAAKSLDYIRSTKELSKAPPHIIGEYGEYVYETEKHHNSKNYVAEIIDLRFRSNVEIDDDLTAQLSMMMDRKADRYSGSSEAVLLLLLDGFHVASPDVWKNVVSSSDSARRFEAVFRIKPANDPFLLYSKMGYWRTLYQR